MVMVNSMRKLWRKFKYKLIQLLRIRTGAHQIALGFVTGFFPCWFPTFGVGAALSIGITKLIKGNMLASLISATFGSILWPMLFFMNFKVGRICKDWMTSHNNALVKGTALDHIAVEDILDIEYIETIDNINEWSELGFDFLIGSIVNSILFTILSYFIIKLILNRYQSTLLRLMFRKKNDIN